MKKVIKPLSVTKMSPNEQKPSKDAEFKIGWNNLSLPLKLAVIALLIDFTFYCLGGIIGILE